MRKWMIGWVVVCITFLMSPLIVVLNDEKGIVPNRFIQSASHFPSELWKIWIGWSFGQPMVSTADRVQEWSLMKQMIRTLVKEWSSVDWQDGRSVLAAELPWLQDQHAQLLWGQAASIAPQENEPAMDLRFQTRLEHIPPLKPIPLPTKQEIRSSLERDSKPHASKPNVLIYHTHNRESWLPELPRIKDADLAYDAHLNVTLLGRRLQKRLASKGVPSIHDHADYPSEVEAFYYPKSYRYSSNSIRKAKKDHPDLRFYFDLHRDSQKRTETTFIFHGKAYAQVYLIIGKKNPRWEQNMQFARLIHETLERKIPGLSKGVWGKGSHGNGEYNQSISTESVLIEIGGVENTLLESNRTVDVLAEALAEVIGTERTVPQLGGDRS